MAQKILVIEDSEIIASLLKDSLELMGYEVYIASSGLEGLRRVEVIKPDVITLDIMMPRLDGLQVLRELKSNENTRGIPVIIISVATGLYRKESLQMGAVAFMKKPLDFNQLHRKIKSITEKKKVVVVEDNSEISKLLQVRLEAAGYKVYCISSGKDIVSLIKEMMPDIILMDVVLPEEDGIMVTKKLKEDEETSVIPVIAFSGYFNEGMDGKKIIGADKFLEKEFSAEDLAEEVKNFLEKNKN